MKILDLPFDVAQSGELVEPFRASKPGTRPHGGESEGPISYYEFECKQPRCALHVSMAAENNTPDKC